MSRATRHHSARQDRLTARLHDARNPADTPPFTGDRGGDRTHSTRLRSNHGTFLARYTDAIRSIGRPGGVTSERELAAIRVNPIEYTERTPKRDRPRCGAACRDGHACQAPAVWDEVEDEPRNGRCKFHGGLSTGPRTAEGRAAVAESNRRRGRPRKPSAPDPEEPKRGLSPDADQLLDRAAYDPAALERLHAALHGAEPALVDELEASGDPRWATISPLLP